MDFWLWRNFFGGRSVAECGSGMDPDPVFLEKAQWSSSVEHCNYKYIMLNNTLKVPVLILAAKQHFLFLNGLPPHISRSGLVHSPNSFYTGAFVSTMTSLLNPVFRCSFCCFYSSLSVHATRAGWHLQYRQCDPDNDDDLFLLASTDSQLALGQFAGGCGVGWDDMYNSCKI